MRQVFARPMLVVVACLAVSLASCSSNNKGKIEGKWKVVSGPGMEQAQNLPPGLDLTMYFEFEPDGTFALGLDSSNKALADMLAQKMGGSLRYAAKYKLLTGDNVEFYGFQNSSGLLAEAFKGKGDRARTSAKIVGDDMTMTDPDGKQFKLTRMKK